ncbi:hypothetical protein CAEBREN_11443 [Caenorhabditis brenneri]|uniref:Sdz-33 F-box domain-containing protein n=1 Tax=Caenorhabditis brenneri TaxID=135651 RepID=G0N0I5_CAEBE|nr:hypothetical protein CAEBREN_11443 [Caenorhabditis brenneri]
MVQEPTHPLLSLPQDEIIENIREMNLEEIIEFSLISKHCKNLVKSAELQGTDVKVIVTFDFVVSFKFEHRRGEQNMLTFDPEISPSEVEVSYKNGPSSIRKTIRRDQFETTDWMEHLCTIFNIQETDSIRFGGLSDEYNPVDIKKYFGVPYSLIIDDTGSDAHRQAILRTFLPVESLTVDAGVLGNPIPPEVLIQNFKTLRIKARFSPQVVTLNNLLLINSKTIDIRSSKLGPKDVNKFIKLWQHGANPQMEYLRIECDLVEENDQESILKGIKYTEIPNTERRLFRFAERKLARRIVDGRNEIWRYTDGVRATIKIDEDDFEMFVWFDHCTV